MAVLTISRELGSEGKRIAQRVAFILGYRLVGKDFIGEILSEYGLIEFPAEYDSKLSIWDYFDGRVKVMIEMLNKVLLAVAATDKVIILGRGCFALLNGYADVINARIQAPFPVRVRRFAERESIEEISKAEAIVRRLDEARASFINSAYGLKWNDARLFDLVVDTGKIEPDLAAPWIADLLSTLGAKAPSDSKRVRDIEVDPVLANAVAMKSAENRPWDSFTTH
jgi:cytidylate kinase